MKNAKAQWIKENLKEGEEYSGLILGKGGESDYHLILRPGEAESVTHEQAKEWAKKAGGELPTRRDQALLYANLKEQFQPRWYWSGAQYAPDDGYAWAQDFGYGTQGFYPKDDYYRARAVRRLTLQQFNLCFSAWPFTHNCRSTRLRTTSPILPSISSRTCRVKSKR